MLKPGVPDTSLEHSLWIGSVHSGRHAADRHGCRLGYSRVASAARAASSFSKSSSGFPQQGGKRTGALEKWAGVSGQWSALGLDTMLRRAAPTQQMPRYLPRTHATDWKTISPNSSILAQWCSGQVKLWPTQDHPRWQRLLLRLWRAKSLPTLASRIPGE
jgi:hypothetical protein